MAELKPITVNTDPAAEAHIYAEDDAAIYQSIVGSDGVMMIGQQCASQVISNNKVRIKDGVLVVGGHFARLPYGSYKDCTIENGQSGRNRNDLIIAKFATTGTGGIDTYTLEVKKGTETTGSAKDPALTQDDLYESGKTREMPLYRVKIEGLSIVAVEQMFELIPTIPTLNDYLADISRAELDESMFAIESFWTVVKFNAYKIGKTVYFNGEFLYTGKPENLQPEEFYSLNKASNNAIIRPKNISHLSMCATDALYKNPVPGFATITTEGLIKYSMPGKTQPYMFISGTYETK